ncbi:MAG: hypothetical protein AB7N76_01680 [Planctomycetota bacterium]
MPTSSQLLRSLDQRSRVRSRLRAELTRTVEQMRSALNSEGPAAGQRLSELLEALLELRWDLERVLNGQRRSCGDDHQSWGALLRRLRDLSWDYTYFPGGEPHTWRELWRGLGQLEGSVRELIELESRASACSR